jgi:catechol 2,3-dioxygenase-like lactoylglutathione lyase family enzyme
MQWQPLVPELVVSDFDSSLAFYLSLGFEIRYGQVANGFACLEREGSQLLLERQQPDSWVAGEGELVRPFGRGINIRVQCRDAQALRSQAGTARATVFRELEDVWYETDGVPIGQRQFIVSDPDGYLIRFCQFLERSK